jgi:hypothetical protein
VFNGNLVIPNVHVQVRGKKEGEETKECRVLAFQAHSLYAPFPLYPDHFLNSACDNQLYFSQARHMLGRWRPPGTKSDLINKAPSAYEASFPTKVD